MTKPPSDEQIKEWLKKENPLSSFNEGFSVADIDPKPWSGHFNYLVSTESGKKFVLRFRGPEWGEPHGILDEYNILKNVASHNVGPHVFYFSEKFFGEPAFLEEYMEGVSLAELLDEEAIKSFPEVAKTIARINTIPFEKDSFPFRHELISYAHSKELWDRRLKIIVQDSPFREAGKELISLLPQFNAVLSRFEGRLQKILTAQGPAFIFESAHIGHCIKTNGGIRFFNWEQVSFGDPSFTLAVFLTSIKKKKYFDFVKKQMLEDYLAERPIGGFAELLEQRLWERSVSNIIYTFWTHTRGSGASATSILSPKAIAENIKDAKFLLTAAPSL